MNTRNVAVFQSILAAHGLVVPEVSVGWDAVTATLVSAGTTVKVSAVSIKGCSSEDIINVFPAWFFTPVISQTENGQTFMFCFCNSTWAKVLFVQVLFALTQT